MVNVREHLQNLVTVKEAAQLLGQSEATIRAKVARGELPAIRIGSTPKAPIRIDMRELEAWLYQEAK